MNLSELLWRGKYDQLLKELEKRHPTPEVIYLKKVVYGIRGYYRRSIGLKVDGNSVWHALSVINDAASYCVLGQYDKAEALLNEIGEEERADTRVMRDYHRVMGFVKLKKGEIAQSLKHSTLARDLTSLDNLEGIYQFIIIASNLGGALRIQGRYDEAIEVLTKAIPYSQDLEDCVFLGHVHKEIAETLMRQNKADEGASHLRLALRYWNYVREPWMLSDAYFTLLLMSMHDGDTRQAEIYNTLLQGIENFENITAVEVRKKLAKALILKKERRFEKKFIATQILEEVVHDGILQSWENIVAIQHLIELYLFELEVSENETILSDVVRLIDQMDDVSRRSGMVTVLFQAQLLKAKYFLITSNLDSAEKILKEIESKANTIPDIMEQINEEKQRMSEIVLHWKKVLAKNSDLKTKVEMSRIMEYLKEVQQIVNMNK